MELENNKSQESRQLSPKLYFKAHLKLQLAYGGGVIPLNVNLQWQKRADSQLQLAYVSYPLKCETSMAEKGWFIIATGLWELST